MSSAQDDIWLFLFDILFLYGFQPQVPNVVVAIALSLDYSRRQEAQRQKRQREEDNKPTRRRWRGGRKLRDRQLGGESSGADFSPAGATRGESRWVVGGGGGSCSSSRGQQYTRPGWPATFHSQAGRRPHKPFFMCCWGLSKIHKKRVINSWVRFTSDFLQYNRQGSSTCRVRRKTWPPFCLLCKICRLLVLKSIL